MMAIARVTTHQSADHWLVVTTACLGAFVVAANSTAVITAVPQIRADLDLGRLGEQWTVNIYFLLAAVLLTTSGRFADIFGKISVLGFGLAAFAIGSLVSMTAEGEPLLLLGRAFQGVGVAAIVSTSVALVHNAVPKEQRAFALGVWASVYNLGIALGPLIGGFFTDVISWRVIFGSEVVLLIVTAALCLRIRSHRLAPKVNNKGEHVDYLGTIFLITALAPFVYAMSAGHIIGWTSWWMVALVAVSLLGLAGLVVRERHRVNPLVHFEFLRRLPYLGAAAGYFFVGTSGVAMVYFFTLFGQSPGGLGMTAFAAGLALLPYVGTVALINIITPKVIGMYPLRWPIVLGMVVTACGFWLLSFTTEQTTYHDLWWKLLIVGMGLGVAYPLLPLAGLRALPEENTGEGSGIINTAYFFGISVGLAAGSSLFAALRRNEIETAIHSLSHHAAHVHDLARDLAHGSPSAVKAALAKFDPGDAAKIEHTLRMTDASAFACVMLFFMVLSLIGAATSFWLIGPQAHRVAVAPAK